MEEIKYHPPNNTKAGADFTSASGQSAVQPSISIDYALYEQYLEGMNLTETQKREFLDTLWHIIVNFVDLGFGVHPLQQAMAEKDCDKILDLSALNPEDVLQSKSVSHKNEPK